MKAFYKKYLFLILFMGCILFFAIVYSMLPTGSFFHSSIKHEDAFQNLKRDTMSSLYQLFITRYEERSHGYSRPSFKDLYMTLPDKDFMDLDLKFENNKLNIGLKSSMAIQMESDWIHVWNATIHYELMPSKFFKKKVSNKSHYVGKVRINRLKIEKKGSGIDNMTLPVVLDFTYLLFLSDHDFQQYYEYTDKRPNRVLYMLSYIPEKVFNKITKYIIESKGAPYGFSENFWRMLYFSTVTITTLGYGDIIPISNTARMLIALESFLGLLLIGLFINSRAKLIFRNVGSKKDNITVRKNRDPYIKTKTRLNQNIRLRRRDRP